MSEITYTVPAMHCGHCKAAVEGKLNELVGVERANADVRRGTVEVTYDESWMSTEQLKGAIEEAGYTLAA